MDRWEIIPLKLVEKNAILSALRFTQGNRDLAARLLGIGRTTMYRKLEQFRIENDAALLAQWLEAQRELALWILQNDAKIQKAMAAGA